MDLQKIKEVLTDKRDDIYRAMSGIARQKKTISYSALFGKYGLDMGDISHRNEAGNFLGEIGEEEHNAGRPMLTAVVVGEQSNMPGEGFFGLAADLGFSITKAGSEMDKLSFFSKQLKEVHQYWSQNKEQL